MRLASLSRTNSLLGALTIAPARARVRDALRLLRQSVLPDPDAPASRSLADAPHDPLRGTAFLGRTTVTLAALALLLVFGTMGFRLRFDERIYPTVSAGAVPVGGLTLGEAEAAVARHADAFERGRITVRHGDQTWTPTLHEVGITVDLDATLAAVSAAGRGNTAVSRFFAPATVLTTDLSIALALDVDAHRLDAWFDRVDRALGQPPVNARLAISGMTVSITPGMDGIGVDRAAARAQLLQTLRAGVPGTIELPTTFVPPDIQAADLQPTQAALEQLLASEVVATSDDFNWTIAGDAIGPYLEVTTSGAGDALTIGVEQAGLAAMLRDLVGSQVARAPVDARLGWEDGVGVVIRTPAQPGRTLDAPAFAKAVAASFLGDQHPVVVPVIAIAPRIDGTNLDALGITTVIGRGDSNFSGGDEARDANVEVAAAHLRGTLVAPGETFSFNAAIGEISYERGYVGALVAAEGGVISDAGGGACQVSTTVFRAALRAGLPIVERYAHTVRLPNYELDGWGPGFDASILQEGPDPAEWPDFKFRNDTPGWLLVEVVVASPHVAVTLYGSNDGREVTLERATLGTNAFAVTRTITAADGGLVADETFASYYEG